MKKIRIYANESVSVKIAEGLRRRGVEAWSARESGNLGLTDEEQLKYALSQKAVIFTHDDDFLKLSVKWLAEGKSHHGIIYSHQLDYPTGKCIRRLKLIVDMLTAEEMVNHIEFL